MNHGRILAAYISRLTLRDLRAMTSAMESAHYAGMNLGINSQLAADSMVRAVCDKSIDRMLEHDKDLIADVVRGEAQ